MRHTRCLFLSMLVLSFVLGAGQANAAYEFYMQITGGKQGLFKGESVRQTWKDWIPCLRLDFDPQASTDRASGLPAGPLQMGVLTVTKEWGAASPQIFRALCTNELLKSVE